jgi:hypothetical protein
MFRELIEIPSNHKCLFIFVTKRYTDEGIPINKSRVME